MANKTSVARPPYTFRLNPIEKNPAEIRACELIDRLMARGYNIKQIVVAALAQADGMTTDDVRIYNNMPDATVDTSAITASLESLFTGKIETLLQDFAEKLLSSGAVGQVHSVETKQATSAFARNFAKGLIERQESASGNFEAEE